jgi:hypothetical protein
VKGMTKNKTWIQRTGRPSVVGKGRGRWWGLAALLLACLVEGAPVRAQIPILDIIQAGIKKVIVATDLEIERMQTETIEAQNTEKAEENDMAQSELTDITGWVQQQRDLFAEFYQELWTVKTVLATYEEVKDMIAKQGRIVAGYKQVYTVLNNDPHFSATELSAMYKVLSGIASESAQNIEHLTSVVTSLVTEMGDGPRLAIIDQTGRDIDKNFTDLARFSQGAFLLSAQRSQSAGDLASTKALYGIQ